MRPPARAWPRAAAALEASRSGGEMEKSREGRDREGSRWKRVVRVEIERGREGHDGREG